jgi:hypothetical protein
MGKVAELSGASFVFSVGDNVYENGLTSESDPVFDDTFTSVYTAPGLAELPWYTMLGNHEYYGNSSGELAPSLHAKDGRWHPFRSNLQRFAGKNGSTLLTLASIDTSPFLSKYRGAKENLDWRGLTPVVLPGDTPVPGEGIDPAPGAQPPTPSLLHRLRAWARGPRAFAQPTAAAWKAWEAAQLAQLEGWLSDTKGTSAWTFVAGHHPVQSWSGKSYGPKDLKGVAGLLEAYRVPLYLNGHNHNEGLGKRADTFTTFACSGGGSLVDPDVKDPGDGSLLFGENAAGFLLVQLDKTEAVLTFVDADAKVMYEHKMLAAM